MLRKNKKCASNMANEENTNHLDQGSAIFYSHRAILTFCPQQMKQREPEATTSLQNINNVLQKIDKRLFTCIY